MVHCYSHLVIRTTCHVRANFLNDVLYHFPRYKVSNVNLTISTNYCRVSNEIRYSNRRGPAFVLRVVCQPQRSTLAGEASTRVGQTMTSHAQDNSKQDVSHEASLGAFTFHVTFAARLNAFTGDTDCPFANDFLNFLAFPFNFYHYRFTNLFHFFNFHLFQFLRLLLFLKFNFKLCNGNFFDFLHGSILLRHFLRLEDNFLQRSVRLCWEEINDTRYVKRLSRRGKCATFFQKFQRYRSCRCRGNGGNGVRRGYAYRACVFSFLLLVRRYVCGLTVCGMQFDFPIII